MTALHQPSLFDQASIQDRFAAFHAENPHVLDVLVRLAREWKDAGHERCAIGMLWETLRWRLGIQTHADGVFRLNDHYRSRYARMLVDEHPEFDGFFELRGLRTE